MQDTNRNFMLNTAASVFYNSLAGFLVLTDPGRAYYYTSFLFLIAGFHLIFLFLAAFRRIRRFLPVGFTGFSILAVLLVHIIFWLLFINIP